MIVLRYCLITNQQRGNEMNSEYAHRRPEPKKAIQVMLDKEHREFVEEIYHNKSAWCRNAVIAAIESHPKWKGAKP